MANNIDLTIFAPKPSFRRFRCFAWLILRRSPTGASAPKRSCFRFASLALRGPSHRNAPSGHSGVAHGLFSFRTDPPSVRRCFARLIRQAETLELQPRSRPPSSHTVLFSSKRSISSRFAAYGGRGACGPPAPPAPAPALPDSFIRTRDGFAQADGRKGREAGFLCSFFL